MALVLHVSGLGLDTSSAANIPASSKTYLQRGLKIIIITIAVIVVVIIIIIIILLTMWVTLRLHFRLKGYVLWQYL